MPGIKHLIECHCKLVIYKKSEKEIYHKFPVYSLIDPNGKIIEKFSKCNNCEALHKIYGIGKSEIFPGKDQTESVLKIEDISFSLEEKMVKVLEKHNSDISNYEHIKNIIDEERWGEIVVLKRDVIGEKLQVKFLKILSSNNFEISNETIEDTIIGNLNE